MCGALQKSETSRPISGKLVCTTEHERTRVSTGRASMSGERERKGTREKNDGNEDVSMDENEKIEVNSDGGSFAEEHWNGSEQNDVPNWTDPDLPMTTGTRKGDGKRTGMRCNRYGDDFLIDKIHGRAGSQ